MRGLAVVETFNPPYDQRADRVLEESSLLGALLTNPDLVEQWRDALDPGHLSDPFIAGAVRALLGGAVDVVTIAADMHASGELSEAEAMDVLVYGLSVAGVGAHVGEYLHRIRQRWAARETTLALAEAEALLADQPALDVWAALSLDGERITKAVGALEVDDLASDVAAYMDSLAATEAAGVPSGLRCLSDIELPRFEPGWYVGIVGTPGAGKTAYALGNVALDAALGGHWVAVASQEMTKPQCIGRLMASLAAVPTHKQRGASFDDAAKLTLASERLRVLPMSIKSRVAAEDLAAFALATSRRFGGGPGLIVLDYLQITPSRVGDGVSSAERLEHISRLCLDAAMVSEAAILVLSQPDKAGGKAARAGGQLTGADAKGTQAFEADAGVILTLTADDKGHRMRLDKSRYSPAPYSWGPDLIRLDKQRIRLEG